MVKLVKNTLRIKEFSFFPNFVGKLKPFKLTYDLLILYFPVVLPLQNICRKFLFASIDCIKSYCLKKIEKISFCKISRFLKFSSYYFEKLNLFPSKNHSAFLTIERYDIDLTNTKISDKNIVPPGGVQAPKGGSFLPLF